MIKEFKEFIMRGNVVDLAVGVIIGGAFGKIVTSMVEDMLMPLIGPLTNGIDFKGLYLNLSGKEFADLDAAKKSGGALLLYGNFLNNVIQFLILAVCIFLVVKAINRLMPKPAEAPAPEVTTRDCPRCLSAIPKAATRCAHCTSDVPAAA